MDAMDVVVECSIGLYRIARCCIPGNPIEQYSRAVASLSAAIYAERSGTYQHLIPYERTMQSKSLMETLLHIPL